MMIIKKRRRMINFIIFFQAKSKYVLSLIIFLVFLKNAYVIIAIRTLKVDIFSIQNVITIIAIVITLETIN